MTALIDRVGQRYGKLVVLKLAPKTDRHTRWICQCDCGKCCVTMADNLSIGHSKSCGCSHFEKRYPREDLAGKRFGMLRVLRFYGRRGALGEAYWECVCDCGSMSIPSGSNLKCGASRSCGCQIRVGLRKANLKHGLTGTKEYRLWAGMLTRCYNSNEKTYRHYGGRGIKVCPRWRGEGGFENFLADMGKRPGKGYEIERKNNYLGYSPRNCTWATKEVQANNKRTTNWVQFEGSRMSMTQACRLGGLHYRRIYTRMRYFGLSFARAVKELGPDARLDAPKTRGRRTRVL